MISFPFQIRLLKVLVLMEKVQGKIVYESLSCLEQEQLSSGQ